jgi:class 3 adenylate cyclase/HAMP domain-containing protein
MSHKKVNINRIINLFLKLLGFKTKNKNNIRRVYFGLRIRFLGLLTIVMFFIILITGLLMYNKQSALLKQEKNIKAGELTKIISGNAEFYLDKDINTTKEELSIKYDTIAREANNFKNANDDIIKIMLVDKFSKVRFSTYRGDINRVYNFSYFKQCLDQDKEELFFKEIKIKEKGKKTKKILTVAYPIFLHKGYVINIINDYNSYYKKYHTAKPMEKRRIYSVLYNKYSSLLSDDFNPVKFPYNSTLDKVTKAWDVDFLFLNLFSSIMNTRKEKIKPGEYWMWNDAWLFNEKQRQIIALKSNKTSIIKEISELIDKRIGYLYSQVEEAKRLGALAILFDIEKINKEISQNMGFILTILFGIYIASIILFIFIINFMIKNLKILERWALEVSEGNIGEKIEISTNDEIGRLADIFNYMLEQITIKFHLEKFVSKSTKSMIEKKKDSSENIELGKTGKKSLAFIFSDVRGFTSFSEKNEPDTVLEVLNLYLELQAKIIKSKKGDIDDYVGDQIMAHFGGEKRADTAISTAIEMAKAVHKLNQKRKKENLPFFEVGIGVHGGDVVVGNIGSVFRMDFACLGDAVNLTSRLCSNALAGEILVSQELFFQAKHKYKFKKIPPISVKGKEKPIKVVKILYN